MDEAVARAIWGSQAVRLLGSAIRGDWGSIDGRTIRDICDWIGDVLNGTNPIPDDARFVMETDICPDCGGNWTEYCSPGCPYADA